jgi:hypothetical protein
MVATFRLRETLYLYRIQAGFAQGTRIDSRRRSCGPRENDRSDAGFPDGRYAEMDGGCNADTGRRTGGLRF